LFDLYIQYVITKINPSNFAAKYVSLSDNNEGDMTNLTPREFVSEQNCFSFSRKIVNSAEDVARRAMAIAADICVYTNGNLTVETIKP